MKVVICDRTHVEISRDTPEQPCYQFNPEKGKPYGEMLVLCKASKLELDVFVMDYIKDFGIEELMVITPQPCYQFSGDEKTPYGKVLMLNDESKAGLDVIVKAFVDDYEVDELVTVPFTDPRKLLGPEEETEEEKDAIDEILESEENPFNIEDEEQ